MSKSHPHRLKVVVALVLIAIGLSVLLLPRVLNLSRPEVADPAESVSNVADYGALDAIQDNQDAIDTLATDLNSSAFLQDAALISRFQLLAAELAMERTTNSEVSALAERIAADQKRIGLNLNNKATAAGIDIPQRLAAKDRARLSRLQRTADTSFDQSYVANAMENDRALLTLFRAASTAPALDSALSIYAKDTLHVLNAHEQEIKSLLDAAGLEK